MAMAFRPDWTMAALEELTARGANVRLGERCSAIGDGHVRTRSGQVQAGIVIGADGPRSIVRRSLGLPSAVELIARQLVIGPENPGFRALQSEAPSVWFDYGKFGAGYGWVFPVEGLLKVGCGVSVQTHDARALKAAFYAWLREIGVDENAGLMQSGSIGCRYVGHRFGNVYLAGDAAGLASPITGEGIGQALVSGREVAREALEPGYRSPDLERLIVSNRRVLETLLHPIVGKALYDNVSRFLHSKRLANLAIQRFM